MQCFSGGEQSLLRDKFTTAGMNGGSAIKLRDCLFTSAVLYCGISLGRTCIHCFLQETQSDRLRRVLVTRYA